MERKRIYNTEKKSIYNRYYYLVHRHKLLTRNKRNYYKKVRLLFYYFIKNKCPMCRKSFIDLSGHITCKTKITEPSTLTVTFD
jgi:hypothetical protein